MDIFSFLFEWMAIFYSVLDIVNVIQGTEYFYILIIYLSFVLRCSRVTWTQFLWTRRSLFCLNRLDQSSGQSRGGCAALLKQDASQCSAQCPRTMAFSLLSRGHGHSSLGWALALSPYCFSLSPSLVLGDLHTLTSTLLNSGGNLCRYLESSPFSCSALITLTAMARHLAPHTQIRESARLQPGPFPYTTAEQKEQVRLRHGLRPGFGDLWVLHGSIRTQACKVHWSHISRKCRWPK